MNKIFFNRSGDLRFIWAFLIGLGITFGLVSLIVAGGFTAGNHWTHVNCKAISEQTGLKTKVEGPKPDPVCYVQVNDKYVPYSKWIENSGN